MIEVENALSHALRCLATTKNDFGSDSKRCQRISEIYQLLKQWKNKIQEKHSCTVTIDEIKKILSEALELKGLSEDELSRLLIKGTSKIQLFCFPYAGGMAALFKEWQTLLPSWVHVEAIEYPGRGTKALEKLAVSLETLLGHLEEEVVSKAEGSFAFFGHSLGAIIAFELAVRLQEKYKLRPSVLFLSACPSPNTLPVLASTKNLDDDGLIDVLHKLNGTSDQLIETQGFREFFLPVIRSDFSLLEDYTPSFEKTVDSPFVLLGGDNDSKVALSDIKEWNHWTQCGSTFHEFEGDHFFINQSSDVQGIISSELKKVVACQITC